MQTELEAFELYYLPSGWLGSRVVSMLDSGAEGSNRSRDAVCRVTVLGKLFTFIVPLFTKTQNS